MEKIISLRIKSRDDKDKIVSALTNSGYIIGVEFETKVTYKNCTAWKVDVYKNMAE